MLEDNALLLILIGIALQLILLVILLIRRNGPREEQVLGKFIEYEKRLDKNESSLRDEFGRNREEISRSAKDSREELNTVFINFSSLVEGKLRALQESVNLSAKTNREELSNALEKMRGVIEKKLLDIQNDNGQKLEKMRETVDEKLHRTLETRLGESFKLVSERLEQVQKGLGEMQHLATGVGDLKKVLSNVKTKGVLGEYQLGAILEQILSPNQYAQNVKTKPGSNDMVEYAVKIPSKEDSDRILWLPLDAKFPSENYERLQAAYEGGNVEDIDRRQKELERTIKTFARDIKEKYVAPPNTTDFAIMFLPFEGLYAEALRRPGLFETLQREFKITIAGPTTLSAFLSSLQMGFRSLAVEKRTSEIWELLGAVRTEFGKFGEVLDKTRDKLEAAGKELEKAGVRSRAIEKKLKDVQTLPESSAQALLGDLGHLDPEPGG
jgi:DNA recombination protein RmuC